MSMRIFPAEQVNQCSDWWWHLRRAIITSSRFDEIIQPVKMRASASQEGLLADLIQELLQEDAAYLTEKTNKPPNLAIANGIAREAESRRWLEFERDVSILQVGFCLHENGLWGCSPDGLLVSDSGIMTGTLELKNPTLATQVKYVTAGNLPSEYRAQVAGHLIVTGLSECLFCSYCPPLPPVVISVRADEFALRLKEELELFTAKYLAALDRLGLRTQFNQMRNATLAHFPEEGVNDHAGGAAREGVI